MHSTSNLEDGYIGSGKRLWYSIKKYGKENFKFEILEFLPDRSSLREREKELVNEDFLKNPLCLNLGLGGGGGHGNRFLTKEQLKKGRQKTDEMLMVLYGENFKSIISKKFHSNLTDEEKKTFIEKIKLGHKKSDYDFGSSFRGKKHLQETKEIIGLKNSVKQKGENNSQFGTCWITNGEKNKKIKKNSLLPDGWRIGRT